MIRKRGKTVAKLLRELKGVGEKTEKLFQKIGITTTDDLLHYYPRNYDSYEAPEEIGSLKENSVVTVRVLFRSDTTEFSFKEPISSGASYES